MTREDYWSRRLAKQYRDQKDKETREAQERERLKVLKDGWGDQSSNTPESAAELPVMPWQYFQVEDQHFVAAVSPVQGSKGATFKACSWVMKTSQQLFVERRKAHHEIYVRIKQLQENLQKAEKELKTLKVKLTIERRAKEAEVEQLRVTLREACEQEVVSIDRLNTPLCISSPIPRKD